MELEPTLSICIPTYNRRELIFALVDSIIKLHGSFEVCVHIDGSTDDTLACLQTIPDDRLRLSSSSNRGRACSIVQAVRSSRGRYIMLFDDDDKLYPEGLQRILADCSLTADVPAAGFIYHMDDELGKRLGSPFPCEYSNFLALRADSTVIGDKKEVVLGDLVRKACKDLDGGYRRVPTSLLWSRVALTDDIVCRHVSVGRKIYLNTGMTANIRNLKQESAWPMAKLYATQVEGYFYGRYRSAGFAVKALVGLVFYTVLSVPDLFRNKSPHMTND